MFNLILKDLLIQKRYLIFSILYCLMFILIFSANGTSTILFIMIPLMIAYVLLMGACGYDDKNKSDILLNSLPISRIDLVISKYLSTFVFMIIGIFITFLCTTLFRFSGFSHFYRLMNLQDMLAVSISITILSSLYFPIYFKFGYQKSRYINMIFFMFFFFIPSFLPKTVGQGGAPKFITYLNSQPNWLITTFIIVILFIITFVSILVSSKIYLNKDL